MIKGGAAPHSDYLSFADNDALDSLTEYTIACFVHRLGNWGGGTETFFDTLDGALGFAVRPTSDEKLNMVHNLGSKQMSGMTALDQDVTYHIALTWDGTNIRVYVDGVLADTQAHSTAIGASTDGIMLLNRNSGSTVGADAALGHVMVYRKKISEASIAKLAAGAGAGPPEQEYLEFWHRCDAVPGKDQVTGEVPTEGGTVDTHADDVDSYWPGSFVGESEREVASRFLRLHREPRQRVQISNGWEALEAELLDPVAFTHPLVPSHTGAGYGAKNWQRGLGVVEAMSINLGRPEVVTTIGNRRRYMATYWEVDKLTVSGDPATSEGMPRLDGAGRSRTFSRASTAWVEDVGGLVRARGGIGDGADEKFETRGELIEASSSNRVWQSSFVNGQTGWSFVQNTGSGSVSVETDVILFDPEVSPGSIKITATSATHDLDLKRGTLTLDGSKAHAMSIDWMQSQAAGGTTEIHLQNTTTGNWLNSDGSWTASRPTGANIPISGNATAKTRSFLSFTTESTASTHTVFLNGTGTTNGLIYYFFHVQIEQKAYATSRMVNEAATYTREKDVLKINNDASLAQRVWPVDKFTTMCRFTPLWSGTPPSRRTILYLYHDANNYIDLSMSGSGNLEFKYQSGGAGATARYDAPALVAYTEYQIVIRRTSSALELDEVAGRCTIFLDGVKGNIQATRAVDITEASSSDLYVGLRQAGDFQMDGYIGEILISPIVFSDAEIAGGL